MGNIPSTNVNILAIDRNIQFKSTGETDLKAGEGVPVVATGNPKDKTATVHGTTTPGGVLIHNPA
jgi:hypothetical protein